MANRTRVNVMDKDNPRYDFYHPFLKTPEGRRAKISKYTKPEIIEQLELACKDMTVKLTRSGTKRWRVRALAFDAFAENWRRMTHRRNKSWPA